MNAPNPFVLAPMVLIALLVAYVWWSLRTKTNNRAKRTAAFVLLWPLVLQGRRTNREKVFLCVGVIIAALLVGWSFTLPNP